MFIILEMFYLTLRVGLTQKIIIIKVSSSIKLIYGSHDWANDTNRKETKKVIRLKNFEVIENCGHFSFLENPKRVAEIIT